MRISRREFVERSAVAVGGMCLPAASALGFMDSEKEVRCAVLDLGEGCALRESLQGYCAVAGEEKIFCAAGMDSGRKRALVVMVPGAVTMQERTAEALREHIEAGGMVVLESGAGFCGASEFTAHRRMLERFFGVAAGEPVDVWSEGIGDRYVRYTWPREMMMRDFSRVVPVAAGDGEAIGQAGKLVVAARKRAGNGELVFLGSPVGPAVWAGDLEAREWLGALVKRLNVS